MKRLIAMLAAVGAGAVLAGPAAAATVSLEGGAVNETGHVKLVSDTSDTVTTNDFSNVLISGVGIKLSDLTTLSTEFNATDDGCAGGSPRFQLHLDDGTIVHVAIGTFSTTTSTFTCQTTNTWESSGNLVGQFTGCRWHMTGDPCLDATELAALGGKTITDVRLVVDGSWAFADKEQTVLVRSVTINTTTYTLGLQPQQPPAGQNPAKFCKAQRTAMGTQAFNELYGTNHNDRNAFGKCVSQRAGGGQQTTPARAHRQVMSAVRACKARGLRRAALGACVAARDNLSATRTEAQERAQSRGKGKGRGRP